MAGAEQRKSPIKNKRGGLSIPVKGGGGILIVGGTLIALGAAFLFRRFLANKRRPPPLPNPVDEIHGKLANDAVKAKGVSDGCDPRIGLQSILLPIHQESQDLTVAADRFVSEIDHTTVIEDVVEKIEFKEVEEVKEAEEVEEKHDREEVKEAEEVEEKHDREEYETLVMESEEEAPDLSYDETGSSSVESSVAAVWPADMMEQEEEEESPAMEMKETSEAEKMEQEEEEESAMEMKETAEVEKDCVPEVMKFKANIENLDAMTRMSEKNQHYKGFIMLLALLVAFGLLFCKEVVFPKIH